MRRSFGNRPYGAMLELSFENVKEDILQAIYNHYHGQQGTLEGFVLPDAVWAGLPSGTLQNQLKQGEPFLLLQAAGIGDGKGNAMEWTYVESPQVESVFRNLSTISIKLSCEFKQ